MARDHVMGSGLRAFPDGPGRRRPSFPVTGSRVSLPLFRDIDPGQSVSEEEDSGEVDGGKQSPCIRTVQSEKGGMEFLQPALCMKNPWKEGEK